MIPDHQTNIAFIAEVSQHLKKFIKDIEAIFQKNEIPYKVLKSVNDNNCRDYMPVQLESTDFVQFIYRPESYFERNEYKYLTDPVRTELENNLIRPFYSRIILDGSNVVKWEDKVVLTNKVLKDNRYQFDYDDRAIIRQLENIFGCRVIIIPALPGDKTGHATNLIRFINSKDVFINDDKGLTEERLEWYEEFRQVLKKYDLNPVMLPCTFENSEILMGGSYLNYLQIGKFIIIPVTGNKTEDENAMALFRSSFTGDYIIETLETYPATKRSITLDRMIWPIKS